MTKLTSSPGRAFPVTALDLGTFAVVLVWLVAAGYALAYLVSH